MTTLAETTIEVRGLARRYGDVQALRGIDFSVRRGEIVGFLGPNGAGKSTTMKILTCWLAASAGEAFVVGRNVASDPIGVRRNIGYLPESVPLYDTMLVYDYLDYMARMRGVPAARRADRVAAVIRDCGLAPMVGKRIDELSKGYRQRVGLAQAMVHEPDVLILDEPTSGLDPNQIIEIRELIRRIGREKTVLLSTHILQEIEALCDRILVIDRGTLVADGTFDELYAAHPDTDRNLEALFLKLTRRDGPEGNGTSADAAAASITGQDTATDGADEDAVTAKASGSAGEVGGTGENTTADKDGDAGAEGAVDEGGDERAVAGGVTPEEAVEGAEAAAKVRKVPGEADEVAKDTASGETAAGDAESDGEGADGSAEGGDEVSGGAGRGGEA